MVEDEDAGVQDDRLPILSSDKPGWRRATHTCNDVYQIDNQIKFFTADAFRGVDSLTFDARLHRIRYHSANQAEHCGDSADTALEQGCDFHMPVVVQRQAPMVQTVRGGSTIAVHRQRLIEWWMLCGDAATDFNDPEGDKNGRDSTDAVH